MTIATVVYIFLFVGSCSTQLLFVDEATPVPMYLSHIGRPNSPPNFQQNTNVNDLVFFDNTPPNNYQVDDRPQLPVLVSNPAPTQVIQPKPILRPQTQTVRPLTTRPPLSTPPPKVVYQNTSIPSKPQAPSYIQNSHISSTISHGIYNLGKEILLRVLENHRQNIINIKSEVISPLSIAGVGYLLYLGSAGQTENELATLLGLNRGTNQKQIHENFGQLLNDIVYDHEIPNEEKEYPEYKEVRVHKISIANALFLNQNFALRRQYENVAHDTYQSEVRQMNFAGQGYEAKRYIDGWVNNKTHGKIPTILPEPPTGNTQMIVVSALYFKALWWEELGVSIVIQQPFYPNGIRKPAVKVDTIIFTSEFLPFYESTELNIRIIGLKYQKQLSTMYIIQSLDSNRETIRFVQKLLTSEDLDILISRMTPTYVTQLTVPKFHLQNEVDLKSIFQQMGVNSLFENANLSPITPNKNEYTNQSAVFNNNLEYLDAVRKSNQFGSGLSISQIHHKVDLVVNEKGTEGGAATAAYGDKIFSLVIKVNTPFLFVARQDKTRLPLFYGVVFEPEQD